MANDSKLTDHKDLPGLIRQTDICLALFELGLQMQAEGLALRKENNSTYDGMTAETFLMRTHYTKPPTFQVTSVKVTNQKERVKAKEKEGEAGTFEVAVEVFSLSKQDLELDLTVSHDWLGFTTPKVKAKVPSRQSATFVFSIPAQYAGRQLFLHGEADGLNRLNFNFSVSNDGKVEA